MTFIATVPVSSMTAPYRHRWPALGVLCLSLLIVVMANTSLIVAAPSMTLDLELTSSQLQWVIDGYTVPYAALMLLFGVAGDRYSRRGALLLGLALFAAGAILGSLAESTELVITARVVMGVAAAIVMPATLSLVSATFPKGERALAISMWVATSGLGIALGPLLAGWILESYSWNATFLINVPIAVAAVAASVLLVPPSRSDAPRPVDVVGGLLSVVAIGCGVYAIIAGLHDGWTPASLVAAAISVCAAVAFVFWELNHPAPLLDPKLFRHRGLSGAVIAVALFFLVTFGAVYYVSMNFQFVLGYGPVETGVRLLPLAGSVVVGALVTGWVAPRVGTRAVVGVGMTLGAASVGSMVFVGDDTGYGLFAAALALLGFSLGLSVSPCTGAIMAQFGEDDLGVAGGVNDTAIEFGGSLGIAILGSVLATTYRAEIAGFLSTLPVSGLTGQMAEQAEQAALAARESIGGASVVADRMRENTLTARYADPLQDAANHAFAQAISHVSLIGFVVLAIGVVVVTAALPRRPLPARVISSGEGKPDEW